MNIPNFEIRLFTNDQYILDRVLYNNIYKILPSDKSYESVIVDIGAHAGFFSIVSLFNNYKTYSVEPAISNIQQLLINVKNLGNINIQNHIKVLPFAISHINEPALSNIKYLKYPKIDVPVVDFAYLENIDSSIENCYKFLSIDLNTLLNVYIEEEEISYLKFNIGTNEDDILLNNNNHLYKVKNICAEISSNTDKNSIQYTFHNLGFKETHTIDLPDDGRYIVLASKESIIKNFQL